MDFDAGFMDAVYPQGQWIQNSIIWMKFASLERREL
jgi:hypothetical protein